MENKRILAIDDDEGIRESVKDALESKGFSVDTASYGKEAVKMIENNKYNIIFVDYNLPDMNGVEVCKQIHGIDGGAVKVFMTGSFEEGADINSREIAFESFGGEIHYLYKPFIRGELLEIVEKILSR
ncbi:MAG: response regulator [Candidatus Omnitrophica bacterium]|nr:response regulator [Candidatus Omnitrophota bacterium]